MSFFDLLGDVGYIGGDVTNVIFKMPIGRQILARGKGVIDLLEGSGELVALLMKIWIITIFCGKTR